MYKYHEDGTLPSAGQIFVFGSNTAGRHGAGAARVAQERYGAQYGKAFGRMKMCYAIPTKDQYMRTLPLERIQHFIKAFKDYIKTVPEETFFVTRVGCGLAGLEDAVVAPMFKGANFNCSFAEDWKIYLEN